MKIFKHEEYTIAQDSKRDFTIVEKNNNFFKLDNATFDSLFGKEKLEFVRNDKDNILYMMGNIRRLKQPIRKNSKQPGRI